MYRSKGTGFDFRAALGTCGEDAVFEDGVRVFHPGRVHIEGGVYVGHGAILEGHHLGEMFVGAGTWIGARCFIHSAGNVHIGARVGIGPGTLILTSSHGDGTRGRPILEAPLSFAPVRIEPHADIGVGAILLPGVTVGEGAQVGAGAVVTKDVPAFAVVAGNPAQVLRYRAVDS
ncbi:MAG: acyltransferase [Myxococcota bacterium]